jgi:predicted peptidase
VKKIQVAAFVAALALASVGYAFADSGSNLKGVKYTVIVEGYDWGPNVRALILDFGQPVVSSSVNKDSFAISVERMDRVTGGYVQAMDWATMKAHDSKGSRTVIDAYVSDAPGKRIAAKAGKYVTVEMKVGPEEEMASPFNFDIKTFLNSYVDVNHTITVCGDLSFANGKSLKGAVIGPDAAVAVKSLVADDFDTKGVSDFVDPVYGKITLHYASFSPAKDSKKNPLIIWLHGAGEGGTNPYIALLGNRVTALAEDPAQKIFGGAYVLVPQTPRVWMNNGQKSYPEDGTTQYTKALKNLIDGYIAKHPDIDTRRIYLGGCSNGGYMTVNMILSYPEFFAAAYPSCEAYADRWISDAQIESIKNVPIWFTQAKNDTTVKAAEGGYVLQTYQRLIAAGAKNVHLTYWDNVVDLSGMWKKADGSPYEYNGHWSWIYALNDQCQNDFDGKTVEIDGKLVAIMEWLAAQSK